MNTYWEPTNISRHMIRYADCRECGPVYLNDDFEPLNDEACEHWIDTESGDVEFVTEEYYQLYLKLKPFLGVEYHAGCFPKIFKLRWWFRPENVRPTVTQFHDYYTGGMSWTAAR